MHAFVQLWGVACAQQRNSLVYNTILLSAVLALSGAAEEQAVSESGLAGLKALLEETHTKAAIVLHRGEVVAEWYWGDTTANTDFHVWSVSKSFASTCIGLLIDDGKIESVDDPVYRYVPAWSAGKKRAVTIRHLLEQESGLRERWRLHMSGDKLKHALDARLKHEPGEESRYNNAGSMVLSAVIEAAAGEDAGTYLRRKLLDPLGMENTSWDADDEGNVLTYAGIHTTARDLARFGQFLLDGGVADGEQLLSGDWIEQATTEKTELTLPFILEDPQPYGWMWWLGFGIETRNNFSALGLYGNHLTVIPELELVGVRLVGSSWRGRKLMYRPDDWVDALAGVITSSTDRRPE